MMNTSAKCSAKDSRKNERKKSTGLGESPRYKHNGIAMEDRSIMDEYISSLNYINACHHAINKIIRHKNSVADIAMPNIPNYLSILHFMGQSENSNRDPQKLQNIHILMETIGRAASTANPYLNSPAFSSSTSRTVSPENGSRRKCTGDDCRSGIPRRIKHCCEHMMGRSASCRGTRSPNRCMETKSYVSPNRSPSAAPDIEIRGSSSSLHKLKTMLDKEANEPSTKLCRTVSLTFSEMNECASFLFSPREDLKVSPELSDCRRDNSGTDARQDEDINENYSVQNQNLFVTSRSGGNKRTLRGTGLRPNTVTHSLEIPCSIRHEKTPRNNRVGNSHSWHRMAQAHFMKTGPNTIVDATSSGSDTISKSAKTYNVQKLRSRSCLPVPTPQPRSTTQPCVNSQPPSQPCSFLHRRPTSQPCSSAVHSHRTSQPSPSSISHRVLITTRKRHLSYTTVVHTLVHPISALVRKPAPTSPPASGSRQNARKRLQYANVFTDSMLPPSTPASHDNGEWDSDLPPPELVSKRRTSASEIEQIRKFDQEIQNRMKAGFENTCISASSKHHQTAANIIDSSDSDRNNITFSRDQHTTLRPNDLVHNRKHNRQHQAATQMQCNMNVVQVPKYVRPPKCYDVSPPKYHFDTIGHTNLPASKDSVHKLLLAVVKKLEDDKVSNNLNYETNAYRNTSQDQDVTRKQMRYNNFNVPSEPEPYVCNKESEAKGGPDVLGRRVDSPHGPSTHKDESVRELLRMVVKKLGESKITYMQPQPPLQPKAEVPDPELMQKQLITAYEMQYNSNLHVLPQPEDVQTINLMPPRQHQASLSQTDSPQGSALDMLPDSPTFSPLDSETVSSPNSRSDSAPDSQRNRTTPKTQGIFKQDKKPECNNMNGVSKAEPRAGNSDVSPQQELGPLNSSNPAAAWKFMRQVLATVANELKCSNVGSYEELKEETVFHDNALSEPIVPQVEDKPSVTTFNESVMRELFLMPNSKLEAEADNAGDASLKQEKVEKQDAKDLQPSINTIRDCPMKVAKQMSRNDVNGGTEYADEREQLNNVAILMKKQIASHPSPEATSETSQSNKNTRTSKRQALKTDSPDSRPVDPNIIQKLILTPVNHLNCNNPSINTTPLEQQQVHVTKSSSRSRATEGRRREPIIEGDCNTMKDSYSESYNRVQLSLPPSADNGDRKVRRPIEEIVVNNVHGTVGYKYKMARSNIGLTTAKPANKRPQSNLTDGSTSECEPCNPISLPRDVNIAYDPPIEHDYMRNLLFAVVEARQSRDDNRVREEMSKCVFNGVDLEKHIPTLLQQRSSSVTSDYQQDVRGNHSPYQNLSPQQHPEARQSRDDNRMREEMSKWVYNGVDLEKHIPTLLQQRPSSVTSDYQQDVRGNHSPYQNLSPQQHPEGRHSRDDNRMREEIPECVYNGVDLEKHIPKMLLQQSLSSVTSDYQQDARGNHSAYQNLSPHQYPEARQSKDDNRVREEIPKCIYNGVDLEKHIPKMLLQQRSSSVTLDYQQDVRGNHSPYQTLSPHQHLSENEELSPRQYQPFQNQPTPSPENRSPSQVRSPVQDLSPFQNQSLLTPPNRSPPQNRSPPHSRSSPYQDQLPIQAAVKFPPMFRALPKDFSQQDESPYLNNPAIQNQPPLFPIDMTIFQPPRRQSTSSQNQPLFLPANRPLFLPPNRPGVPAQDQSSNQNRSSYVDQPANMYRPADMGPPYDPSQDKERNERILRNIGLWNNTEKLDKLAEVQENLHSRMQSSVFRRPRAKQAVVEEADRIHLSDLID